MAYSKWLSGSGGYGLEYVICNKSRSRLSPERLKKTPTQGLDLFYNVQNK
jgi:hypothetical protein